MFSQAFLNDKNKYYPKFSQISSKLLIFNNNLIIPNNNTQIFSSLESAVVFTLLNNKNFNKNQISQYLSGKWYKEFDCSLRQISPFLIKRFFNSSFKEFYPKINIEEENLYLIDEEKLYNEYYYFKFNSKIHLSFKYLIFQTFQLLKLNNKTISAENILENLIESSYLFSNSEIYEIDQFDLSKINFILISSPFIQKNKKNNYFLNFNIFSNLNKNDFENYIINYIKQIDPYHVGLPYEFLFQHFLSINCENINFNNNFFDNFILNNNFLFNYKGLIGYRPFILNNHHENIKKYDLNKKMTIEEFIIKLLSNSNTELTIEDIFNASKDKIIIDNFDINLIQSIISLHPLIFSNNSNQYFIIDEEFESELYGGLYYKSISRLKLLNLNLSIILFKEKFRSYRFALNPRKVIFLNELDENHSFFDDFKISENIIKNEEAPIINKVEKQTKKLSHHTINKKFIDLNDEEKKINLIHIKPNSILEEYLIKTYQNKCGLITELKYFSLLEFYNFLEGISFQEKDGIDYFINSDFKKIIYQTLEHSPFFYSRGDTYCFLGDFPELEGKPVYNNLIDVFLDILEDEYKINPSNKPCLSLQDLSNKIIGRKYKRAKNGSICMITPNFPLNSSVMGVIKNNQIAFDGFKFGLIKYCHDFKNKKNPNQVITLKDLPVKKNKKIKNLEEKIPKKTKIKKIEKKIENIKEEIQEKENKENEEEKKENNIDEFIFSDYLENEFELEWEKPNLIPLNIENTSLLYSKKINKIPLQFPTIIHFPEPCNLTETLENALIELKNQKSFSINNAVKTLYPKYGNGKNISTFISNIWTILGNINYKK